MDAVSVLLDWSHPAIVHNAADVHHYQSGIILAMPAMLLELERGTGDG
jgi:hypothetical protein